MFNFYHIGTLYFAYDLIKNKKIKNIDKNHHIITIISMITINLIYKKDTKKEKKLKNILHVLYSLLEINTIALRMYVNSNKYKNFFYITWIYRILVLITYSFFNLDRFIKYKNKMYIPLIASSFFYSFYYYELWYRIKEKKKKTITNKKKSKITDPIG